MPESTLGSVYSAEGDGLDKKDNELIGTDKKKSLVKFYHQKIED